MTRWRATAAILVAVLGLGACAGVDAPQGVPDANVPLPAAERAALDAVFADPVFLARGDFTVFTASSDPRVVWPLIDLLRFHQGSPRAFEVQAAIGRVAGLPLDLDWVQASNAAISADTPAFPDYLDLKRIPYLQIDPDFDAFLTPDADLDLRLVSWGGVSRDGISTLDDPEMVPADQVWIPGDEEVFGVVVNGDARAYPRRVMEVHELVNDHAGGTRFALPYCTLCGSATAFVTDDVSQLRTSGLLQRSNKLMYDEATESLLDQFTGVGLSGPLRGTTLPRLSVVATSWDAWVSAHPTTTLVSREATDRRYDDDPLDGRDDGGPIFPVGPVDERLPEQTRVIGVRSPTGAAVAFPQQAALAALASGTDVQVGGISLRLINGLPLALDERSATELPAQVAFWFAWSQFRPDTLVWDG